MKANPFDYLVTLMLAVAAVPAMAAVSVTFTQPEKYADTGFYGRDKSTALAEIEKYLKVLGERYLPPNQELKIEVLDVDLAGRIDPASRRYHDVRVLRGRADWPQIELKYTLASEGRVLAEKQETVSDMAYLTRTPIQYGNTIYPYEKRMLEEWFKRRFGDNK